MAKKMMVLESVVVYRDGKRVRPKIGEAFSFNQGEIDEITEARPQAIRSPVNESDEIEADAKAPGADDSERLATDEDRDAGLREKDKPAAKAAQAKRSADKPGTKAKEVAKNTGDAGTEATDEDDDI